MRLVVRLLIAGLALASGGTLAGCSGAAGLADAQGATNPEAVISTTPLGHAVTATVPAASATKTAAGPVLDVVGVPGGVKAKEGILVDAATGQVLWSKGADVPQPIASITKVMTALVILQAGGLTGRSRCPRR